MNSRQGAKTPSTTKNMGDESSATFAASFKRAFCAFKENQPFEGFLGVLASWRRIRVST
ncbi:MAG: hypothetical protein AABZ67_15850 [Pseudomonadota bacterium]